MAIFGIRTGLSRVGPKLTVSRDRDSEVRQLLSTQNYIVNFPLLLIDFSSRYCYILVTYRSVSN